SNPCKPIRIHHPESLILYGLSASLSRFLSYDNCCIMNSLQLLSAWSCQPLVLPPGLIARKDCGSISWAKGEKAVGRDNTITSVEAHCAALRSLQRIQDKEVSACFPTR